MPNADTVRAWSSEGLHGKLSKGSVCGLLCLTLAQCLAHCPAYSKRSINIFGMNSHGRDIIKEREKNIEKECIHLNSIFLLYWVGQTIFKLNFASHTANWSIFDSPSRPFAFPSTPPPRPGPFYSIQVHKCMPTYNLPVPVPLSNLGSPTSLAHVPPLPWSSAQCPRPHPIPPSQEVCISRFFWTPDIKQNDTWAAPQQI